MGLLEQSNIEPPCQTDCEHYTDHEMGIITEYDLKVFCSNCRRLSKGNLAMCLHAYMRNEKQVAPNKPRGTTIDKRYGSAIKTLKLEGKSNREIAKILGISRNSVNKHIKESE